MPITALTTLIGSLMMFGSWFFVRQRNHQSGNDVNQQVRWFGNYFLNMGIFFLLMSLPYPYLSIAPEHFPLAMAWGYVGGHVFLYISLIYLNCLTFSMVPRLAGKQKYAVAVGAVITVGLTAINAVTMIFGTQPQYDTDSKVTLFNAHPIVGAGIGISAFISIFAPVVLMIINGVRNREARLRSFMLAGGLFVLMTGGPIHDVARTWQLYLLADILVIVSILVITGGVLYRIDERIGGKEEIQKASPVPGSV